MPDFDLLATGDHPRPGQHNEGLPGRAWVTMTAFAERTTKVWIESQQRIIREPRVHCQHPHGPAGQECVITFYGKEVLPKVRGH